MGVDYEVRNIHIAPMPIQILPAPDAEVLRALFEYDPITGILIWKARPPTTRENKVFNTKYAGNQVGALNTCGHRQVRVNGRLITVHRIVWKMMTNTDPVDQIDHIDGDPDNNRWGNLRASTQTQNTWNLKPRSNCTSGHSCIYPMNTKRAASKKFRVLMRFQGKQRLVGDYHTFNEAKAAYETAFAKYRDPSFKR